MTTSHSTPRPETNERHPEQHAEGARAAIAAAVAECADEARAAWSRIHANPEIGFQETLASATLADLLERRGFAVRRGVADMPTAFVADSVAGTPGPSVGFMAEYDALPELGHACGHSLSGVASALAAIALARVQPPDSLTRVLGTPAEESVVPGAGGKLRCLSHGLFKNLDAVMMSHAGPRDVLETTVAARAVLRLKFFGKASHAGAAPHKGINALTAVVQTLNGINGLYQQLGAGHRINAIITDGGRAVNVIPEYAAASLQLRANTMEELNALESKVIDCARAGALTTGCRFTSANPSPSVSNLVPNEPLLEAYAANAKRLGFNPVRELETCISTDAGTVSRYVPCIHPFFAVGCSPALELHSRPFAAACGREEAFQRLLAVAEIMAQTGYEVLTDAALRARIREDFLRRACADNE